MTLSRFRTVLPVLLLMTPTASADVFFWNPRETNPNDWSNHLNWAGPDGEFPNGNNDDAFISGAEVNDPILDFTYQLGSLTLQLNGDLANGDGQSNHALIVTANGGHSGLTLVRDFGSRLTLYRSSNMNDLDTDDLLVRDGGVLSLRDGAVVQVDDIMDIKAGSELEGEGVVEFTRDDGTNQPRNDGLIRATGGTLMFFGHPDTIFDLDGVNEDGRLEVDDFSKLIVDTKTESGFNSTLDIGFRSEVHFAHPWFLAADPGSTVSFNGGSGDNRAILIGTSITFQGDMVVTSGDARIASTSLGLSGTTTIGTNRTLEIDSVVFVDTGAVFQGAGLLHFRDTTSVETDEEEIQIAVDVLSDGAIIVAGTEAVGSVLFETFEQGPAGMMMLNICEPVSSGFDEVVVTGAATLDGQLELTGLGNCEPDVGDEFPIITAASIVGQFTQVTGLPNIMLVYDATSVTAVVIEACPADLDTDGTVGVLDLLVLLGAWGSPGADLDDDGTTGVLDLLVLLGAWGAC